VGGSLGPGEAVCRGGEGAGSLLKGQGKRRIVRLEGIKALAAGEAGGGVGGALLDLLTL
jgi:hypothetical protein